MLGEAPLLLAVAQASAFAATLDIFPQRSVPRSVRAAFALLLVPLLLASRSHNAPAAPTVASAIVGGVLVGAAFGLSASLVASGARTAGSLIDNVLAAGLFAQGVFAGAGPIGRLYSLGFIVVFVGSGACTRLIAAFVAGSTSAAYQLHSAHAAAVLVRSCMLGALALAGPALLMQALAAAISGVIARIAPSINAMLLTAPLCSAFTILCIAAGGATLWPTLMALSEKVIELSGALVH